MKKRLLVILLVIFMLVGCGNQMEEMAQKNGVHWTAMAAGATEIGYYNGEFVLRERIYLKN